MEEDSVPQRPSSGASGAGASEASEASEKSAKNNIWFKTADGTEFEINNPCGFLGNNVMIGSQQVMHVTRDSEVRKRCKAKKPLSEVQEEPARHVLQRTTENMTKEETILLGRRLNLSDAKIDEIKIDYNTSGAAEIKYQILAEWLKKDENPTIAKLAWALNEIKRGDLSDKLPR